VALLPAGSIEFPLSVSKQAYLGKGDAQRLARSQHVSSVAGRAEESRSVAEQTEEDRSKTTQSDTGQRGTAEAGWI